LTPGIEVKYEVLGGGWPGAGVARRVHNRGSCAARDAPERDAVARAGDAEHPMESLDSEVVSRTSEEES